MEIIEETLSHWRKERTALLKGIADLESGRKLHSERRDTDWLDVTVESIRDSKDQVAQLDRLIAAYENRKA